MDSPFPNHDRDPHAPFREILRVVRLAKGARVDFLVDYLDNSPRWHRASEHFETMAKAERFAAVMAEISRATIEGPEQ